MAEFIIQWFMSFMKGMPSELIVFVVSMIPIVELRGGIICASLLHLPPWKGILYCLAGNMIPVPFILLFITPIFSWLKKSQTKPNSLFNIKTQLKTLYQTPNF